MPPVRTDLIFRHKTATKFHNKFYIFYLQKVIFADSDADKLLIPVILQKIFRSYYILTYSSE